MDGQQNFWNDMGQAVTGMIDKFNLWIDNFGEEAKVEALDLQVQDDIKVKLNVLVEREMGENEDLKEKIGEKKAELKAAGSEKINLGTVSVPFQELEAGKTVVHADVKSNFNVLEDTVVLEAVAAQDGDEAFMLKMNVELGGKAAEVVESLDASNGGASEDEKADLKADSDSTFARASPFDRVTDPAFIAEQRRIIFESVAHDPSKLELFLKKLHAVGEDVQVKACSTSLKSGIMDGGGLINGDTGDGYGRAEVNVLDIVGGFENRKAEHDRLGYYDGNALVNVNVWFRDLRLFLMMLPIPPNADQALAHLVGRLRGRARFAYEAMPANVKADFDLIEAALKQKFPIDEFVRAAEMKLQGCYQEHGESVEHFTQRISELVYILLDGKPEDEIERTLRRETMFKLLPEIREYVEEMDPKSYDRVVLYARRGEAALQRRRNEVAKYRSGEVFVVQDDRRCFSCSEIGHISRNCPSEKRFRQSFDRFGDEDDYGNHGYDQQFDASSEHFDKVEDDGGTAEVFEGEQDEYGNHQTFLYSTARSPSPEFYDEGLEDDQEESYGAAESNFCGFDVLRCCYACGAQGHLARNCPVDEFSVDDDFFVDGPQPDGLDYGNPNDYSIPDALQPRRSAEVNVVMLDDLFKGAEIVKPNEIEGEYAAQKEAVKLAADIERAGKHQFLVDKGPENSFSAYFEAESVAGLEDAADELGVADNYVGCPPRKVWFGVAENHREKLEGIAEFGTFEWNSAGERKVRISFQAAIEDEKFVGEKAFVVPSLVDTSKLVIGEKAAFEMIDEAEKQVIFGYVDPKDTVADSLVEVCPVSRRNDGTACEAIQAELVVGKLVEKFENLPIKRKSETQNFVVLFDCLLSLEVLLKGGGKTGRKAFKNFVAELGKAQATVVAATVLKGVLRLAAFAACCGPGVQLELLEASCCEL